MAREVKITQSKVRFANIVGGLCEWSVTVFFDRSIFPFTLSGIEADREDAKIAASFAVEDLRQTCEAV